MEDYTCILYFLKTPMNPMYNTTRYKIIHILSLYRLIPFSLLLFIAITETLS